MSIVGVVNWAFSNLRNFSLRNHTSKQFLSHENLYVQSMCRTLVGNNTRRIGDYSLTLSITATEGGQVLQSVWHRYCWVTCMASYWVHQRVILVVASLVYSMWAVVSQRAGWPRLCQYLSCGSPSVCPRSQDRQMGATSCMHAYTHTCALIITSGSNPYAYRLVAPTLAVWPLSVKLKLTACTLEMLYHTI